MKKFLMKLTGMQNMTKSKRDDGLLPSEVVKEAIAKFINVSSPSLLKPDTDTSIAPSVTPVPVPASNVNCPCEQSLY